MERLGIVGEVMKPRFDVASIYYNSECNMNPKCLFCYTANREIKGRKPDKWWLELPKYLKGIVGQAAFAGWEPLLHLYFVKEFAKECRKYDIIPNITTNGKIIPHMKLSEIKKYLSDLGMVSISVDDQKIKTSKDLNELYWSITRLQSCGIKVGINILAVANTNLEVLMHTFFDVLKVGQVHLLHKKPWSKSDKLDLLIPEMKRLQEKYPSLYFDDFILMLNKYGYTDWKETCHYGKNSFSIYPDGAVSGCSFAGPEFYLDEPKDILKLKEYKFKERFKCVYSES